MTGADEAIQGALTGHTGLGDRVDDRIYQSLAYTTELPHVVWEHLSGNNSDNFNKTIRSVTIRVKVWTSVSNADDGNEIQDLVHDALKNDLSSELSNAYEITKVYQDDVQSGEVDGRWNNNATYRFDITKT